MKPRILGAAVVCMMITTVTCTAADFTLREYLGHNWTHERITFPLTGDQATRVAQNRALVDSDDREITYQVTAPARNKPATISFQTDLSPLESRAFRFTNEAAGTNTDIEAQESAGELRISNDLIGLAIRTKLKDGEGPVAGIRLRNGQWIGDSSLIGALAVESYTADIMAGGPVFAEVECHVEFADGGQWDLRFRIEQGEPVVVVEERYDAPSGGTFRLKLGSDNYRPDHLLFRSGEGQNLGQVNSRIVGSDTSFMLEPWLHWWESELQGLWLALYKEDTPAVTADDMLMIGLLQPGEWKDPQWSGLARQVEPKVPVRAQLGLMTASFPIGGGGRVWMIATPEEQPGTSILAQNNRKLSPLPQKYLIKHGDFPLDQVKDYVLEWDDEHETYPRLFVGKQDLQVLSTSLSSDPEQLARWEGRQPIDKYNIDDPLREYFASGSALLGAKIVGQSSEWLNRVVNEDLLLQNNRVSLGVAPHSQAVLLLPTINLSDAALGAASMTAALRQRFLAQLAFLAYTVNREDYWSPARGFAANPNMTTTVALYQVALASLIPTHPEAPEWAARGLATLRTQLLEWSDEEGGWLEAPHYAVVAYDHMLAAFIMAARAGFANDLYHERMRKVVEWLARISTPRDQHTGGFRHLPPIGNTYYGESTGIFCTVAGLWKDVDPAFAGQMQWMCDEQGSPGLGLGWSFPSMAGYTDLLKAHHVTPRIPDYGSTWFSETGVVMRNHIDSDRETWLYLIAGSNHEHYDLDSGSIVLWGKGRILADDWGYIGQHGEEFHSLLSSFFVRGDMHISGFSTQPAFDYVAGAKGAWQRQIAFVKDEDPLGPNFFLIRDTHRFEMAADWRLWLTTGADANAVRIHDQGATVTGSDDVDFDLFFYPAEPLALRTETVSQTTNPGNRDGHVGAVTIRQTALIKSMKTQGSVTVLVYPRLRAEHPPVVLWHADGRIAEVSSTAGRDLVFMDDGTNTGEMKEFSIAGHRQSFTGSAGLIRIRGQSVLLALGSPGTIHFGDRTISSGIAKTETFEDGP